MDMSGRNKYLTFAELEIGERFIAKPTDENQGGMSHRYNVAMWIFEKIEPVGARNARRESYDTYVTLEGSMLVIRVT